ncbi:flippase [Phenylobacterium koreense]|uniref:O-antigen/teichoic acid export membrane protein n=1 Tax=Phenylobacterium koreense TaxID=266125 RepID=A0ABV2EM62_9CAUL
MSVRRHASYNLVGSILPLLLSLVTVPIYLKLIGPDRYGVLAIAWLLLGYFGLFDLGLGRATSYRIAALRDASAESRANTFWAALTVNVGMGVIGGVALWVAARLFFGQAFKVDEGLRPEILTATPLLAASVPVATLTGVLSGALQGREKFLQTNTVSVTSTAMFQLFPLGLAWAFGPNLVLLLGGALSARLLSALALGCLCHLELTKGHPRRLDRREIPLLMKYGGWVTLTSCFGPLLVIVDRFVIGAVLGAVAVTTYTVPMQLAQRLAIVPSALTTALFPKMSAQAPEEQRAIGAMATRTLVALISLPVLGGVFLIEPFLRLWVGAEIGGQAGPLGRLMLIGFWANAFALVPFTRLQASGRPDIVTKVLLIEIPPYFLALYLGMTHFGLLGAGFVLVARHISDCLLLTWAAGRDFRNLPLLAGNLALLALAAAAASIWSIADIGWWSSAVALSLISLATGYWALPKEIKAQLVGKLRQAGLVNQAGN